MLRSVGTPPPHLRSGATLWRLVPSKLLRWGSSGSRGTLQAFDAGRASKLLFIKHTRLLACTFLRSAKGFLCAGLGPEGVGNHWRAMAVDWCSGCCALAVLAKGRNCTGQPSCPPETPALMSHEVCVRLYLAIPKPRFRKHKSQPYVCKSIAGRAPFWERMGPLSVLVGVCSSLSPL